MTGYTGKYFLKNILLTMEFYMIYIRVHWVLFGTKKVTSVFFYLSIFTVC